MNKDEEKKNVHIVSLGCARNLVDSEVMLGLLQNADYQVMSDPDEAEYIIVNTCGFIDEAKQESIDKILELAEYKKNSQGRCKKLVVTGCLSERYPEELKASLPEVDLITGTAAFSQIVEDLDELEQSGEQPAGVPRLKKTRERLKDYDLPRVNSLSKSSAYLKLAEGCAKKCSFCVIPKLRGPLRSRSIENLLKEANSLVQGGVSELNLIAQDLTDFGRDRHSPDDLLTLLHSLVEIEGLNWIRLFYVYPEQLNQSVIDFVATAPKLCKYLDVPIQHINNRILTNMNRRCTGDDIRNMLKKLRAEVPDLVLRTSLMVGFPGESESDFAELMDFVEEFALDHVGVFTYSHEEGTASYRLGDTVSDDLKQERKRRLMDLQESLQENIFVEKWQGRQLDVLVEGFHEETDLLLKGRHYGQAPDVDNLTLINKGEAALGTYARVQINERVGMDLLGEIL